MTTAPHRSRHLVGAHAVFSVRSSGPGNSRPLAVTALLDAVRAVVGVRDVELRTAAGGDRTLHVDLVDGADEAAVAWSVTRILDERLGVEVDQTRSVLVDEGVDEGRSVPLDGPQRRVHLERLQVVTGGLDVRVDVALATTSARVVGSASGPAVERTVLRTVAGATLNAVDALLEGRARCGLDQAELTDIGSDRIAVAVVTLLTPGQVDRLAGAALVRGDARQAMVRAVLSALNRRFESLLPESGSTSSWTATSLHPAPPLAVENTATYRTIMAGTDFPDGSGGPKEPAYEADPEPVTTGGGGYSPRADVAQPDVAQPDATQSEVTRPDPAPPSHSGESTARGPLRGGRAARRAAAAARGEEASAGRADGGGRAAHTAEPEYAPSTPFISPSSYPDPIATPTGEFELSTGSGDAGDLGDWAAATWDRLVHNEVTKDTPDPAADPLPAPTVPAAAYPAYQEAGEPAVDARASGDLSAATSAVFTPPVEPEAYTPPAEPVWSWPNAGEPAPASAEWAPPRWDEPAAEPGNVSSPYGRSANGAATSGGLGGGFGGLGGGLGGSYLEREYGGLGTPSTGAPSGGRGRHGRAESPVSGQPAAPANGYGISGAATSDAATSGYGTNGYGQDGYGVRSGYGQNGYGQNGYGQPGGGPNGVGPNGVGPSGARPSGYGPAFGGPRDLGGLGPASGSGGYGGLGPAPTSSGPLSPGPAQPTPPRRRHAAEPTGTWPVVHDPLGPNGARGDSRSFAPPNQREPSPVERGYRPGDPGDRREQQGPRPRRRYPDDDNGRHGGGDY